MSIGMNRLSHIMVTLSTLMLLLFGTGGIGWQRCSCTGKVSLVLPAQQGCCSRGSTCMTVTISHLSAADLQTEGAALPQVEVHILADNLLLSETTPLPCLDDTPAAGHAYWYPPGWVATQGMVMRV